LQALALVTSPKLGLQQLQTVVRFTNVQGAINNTHIAISKPLTPYLQDYSYHKMGGYLIITQAIVDCQK
jgi:hypothetical protein